MHAHTQCRKISTTRPRKQHNTLCVCCLRGWSITLTRGIRPPFDHQAICRCHHRNSPSTTAANTRFCMFWRPTTPLSNVGQNYCIIFDVTLFRYLKQLFCLVWRVFTESSGTGSSTLKSEPRYLSPWPWYLSHDPFSRPLFPICRLAFLQHVAGFLFPVVRQWCF